MGSVDLRAAKLLAVKVGDFKKDLISLKTVSKFQEDSSILKVEFTLSK